MINKNKNHLNINVYSISVKNPSYKINGKTRHNKHKEKIIYRKKESKTNFCRIGDIEKAETVCLDFIGLISNKQKQNVLNRWGSKISGGSN